MLWLHWYVAEGGRKGVSQSPRAPNAWGSNFKATDMIITLVLQTRLGGCFSFEFSR